MSRREDLRAQYIQVRCDMGLERLIGATRLDYQFDEPAERGTVMRESFAGYMQRLHRHGLGKNTWILEHEVRQDMDGILTGWHCWRVIRTDLTGAAVAKTSGDDVFLERISYFKREP